MSERLAFLFPGQGAQTVGMGRDLYERSPGARAVFETVDAVCGWSVSQLCFEGPEGALKDTARTQPALFAVSVAALEACRASGFYPSAAAGHSIGEYAAFVAAGALSVEAGARLVKARGEAMAHAAAERAGTMAAVLGLEETEIAAACTQAVNVGVVTIANRNAPGQIVISGESAAVAVAADLCRQRGARRVVPLAVSGGFHSPLMEPAMQTMRGVLELTEIADPTIPVVANVTAAYVRTGAGVRQALAAQVVGSVRWIETIERLAGDGYTTFVECGPGTVLGGLNKRIAPQARTLSVGDGETLAAAREALA